VKLPQDPNNTKWTRDTGGFGHKIMAAQGWQPGEMLGAKDAAHAEFHTAANASHIRVLVKDDNLGLGAKRGSGLAEGECTGLDVFQNLLGRLNGKDGDALMKEQRSREDLKRAIYAERRWGSIRFVNGGFLRGDKVQELIEKEEDHARTLTHGTPGTSADAATESDASQSSQPQTVEVIRFKAKEKKKKRKLKEDMKLSVSVASNMPESGLDNGDAVDGLSALKPEISKKKRKQSGDALEESATSSSIPESEKQKSSKKKKKHREKREATIGEEKDTKNPVQVAQVPSRQSVSTTPVSNSGTSTPLSMLGGRHAVRSRNIAQKRLAVLDTASLNQVC
jgi:Pin2-interacting protein X1